MRVCVDPVQEEGDIRVLRGGSFFDLAPFVRSSLRSVDRPSDRIYTGGLRITLDPTGPAIDPSKHEWGHIRGGSWIRRLGEIRERTASPQGTQSSLTSLGLRVCVDPAQEERAIFALRGGSFNMPSLGVRPSYRNSSRLTSRNDFDGFRLSLSL